MAERLSIEQKVDQVIQDLLADGYGADVISSMSQLDLLEIWEADHGD